MGKWNACHETLNAVSTEEWGRARQTGVTLLRGLQEGRALRGVQLQGQEHAPPGVPPPAVVHACLLRLSPWGDARGRNTRDGVERRLLVGSELEKGVYIIYGGSQGMAAEFGMFPYWQPPEPS